MAKRENKPTSYSPTPAIWRLRETATAAYTTGARQEHITALKAGLSMQAFDLLAADMGLSAQDLAAVLHIAPRTLARRKKEGRLQPTESERLYRLGTLFEKAILVLGDAGAARVWFNTPAPALDGAAPLHFADTEPGAREVEDLLGRLEHGVFT